MPIAAAECHLAHFPDAGPLCCAFCHLNGSEHPQLQIFGRLPHLASFMLGVFRSRGAGYETGCAGTHSIAVLSALSEKHTADPYAGKNGGILRGCWAGFLSSDLRRRSTRRISEKATQRQNRRQTTSCPRAMQASGRHFHARDHPCISLSFK